MNARTAAMAMRADARVAAFDEDAIVEHFKRTNAAVVATTSDINDWKARTVANIHQRVTTTPSFSASCYAGAPVSACMTTNENATNSWIVKVWDPFVLRWNGYVASKRVGVLDGHDELNKYDAELALHRDEFEKFSGDKLVTPTPPQFKDEKSGGGGGGGDTSKMIWILGVGFLAYLGLAYIAPALLGAATSTRSSLTRYRSA